MYVLLCLESLALLLQFVAEHNVQVLSLVRSLLVPYAILIELWVVGVLHVVASVMTVFLIVYTGLHEVSVKLVDEVELALEVNHRTCLALLVDKVESRNVSILSHLGIISTECRGDVYDTSTVVGCYVVAEDYTESLALHLHKLVASVLTCKHLLWMCLSIFCHELRSEVVHLLAWLHPRHKLLVVHSLEFCTLEVAGNAPWAHLLLLVKRSQLALLALLPRLQVSLDEVLSHNDGDRLTIIEIVCLNRNVVDLRTNAERNIRRQSPRSCSPCHEVRLAPLCPLFLRIADEELNGSCQVLHVAIATGLVELVRRQSGTCSRRVRLNGVALVQQTLVVELFEEPP